MYICTRTGKIIVITSRNDSQLNKSLGQFVKEKRKSIGLTQERMADKAGVGLRFLRELERDKPTLQINKVNQVLKLFGYELGPVLQDRNKLFEEIDKRINAQ